jgi:hypothetical protein
LLEHTNNNEELLRNHGYIDATIDRIGYEKKATDNFAAEARKQDNELSLGVQKNTRGQPVKNYRSVITVRLYTTHKIHSFS